MERSLCIDRLKLCFTFVFCKSNVKNLFKNKRDPGQKIVVANFGLRCNKSDISAFCFCSSSNFPADGDGVEKLGVKKIKECRFCYNLFLFLQYKAAGRVVKDPQYFRIFVTFLHAIQNSRR